MERRKIAESLNLQEQSYILLQDCVDALENATSHFVKCLSAPIYDSDPKPHYVFKDTDQRTYVVLRCVRIVSSLNASLALLKYGHVQEIGVLLRSILEFIHDIDFVFAGFVDKDSTENIQNKVNSFFSEEYKNTERLLEKTRKDATIPRKKVYASLGRMFGGNNTHRARQIAKTLEDRYSGYVHGNYHHTMELWNHNKMCFEMKGQPYQIMRWLTYMSLLVHAALQDFSIVSSEFGLDELKNDLVKKRIELESSSMYNDN